MNNHYVTKTVPATRQRPRPPCNAIQNNMKGEINMFEILCYIKAGNKQIATLRTSIVPRIDERINIDTPEITGLFRTAGRINDIEYKFNKDGILQHILIFIDED